MNTKIVLSAVAVVVAFALIASPLLAADDAFAKKKVRQSISQSNSNSPTQVCVSGGANLGSCTSANTQINTNFGSNVNVD